MCIESTFICDKYIVSPITKGKIEKKNKRKQNTISQNKKKFDGTLITKVCIFRGDRKKMMAALVSEMTVIFFFRYIGVTFTCSS